MEMQREDWQRIRAMIEAGNDAAAEEGLTALLDESSLPAGGSDIRAQAGLALVELLVAQGRCDEAQQWALRLSRALAAEPELRVEVARIEFAAFRDSDEGRDIVQQVDALRASEQFLVRYGGDDETVEMRRLHGLAALARAAWLRELERESEALEAYIALAERLKTTDDRALRQIRLRALYLAAAITDDPQQAVELLDTYLAEPDGEPVNAILGAPRVNRLDAHRGRLQALRSLGRDSAVLASDGQEVLDAWFQQARDEELDLAALWACDALSREVSDLHRAASDGQAADAVMHRLLARFASVGQPEVRARLAVFFLRWISSAAPDANRYSDWECAQWQALLSHYDKEADARVLESVAPAWLRLGSAQTQLRRPHEGEATLAAFIGRFESSKDPEIARHVARARLDRAIALTDLGRGDDALAVCAALRREPVGEWMTTAHRACIAEAGYWYGRDLRERGHAQEAAREIDALLERFAADASPKVRLHAANALFSEWQDALSENETDPGRQTRALAAMARFEQVFCEDRDLAIRRIDATRQLRQGGILARNGDLDAAAQAYRMLIDRFANDGDGDLRGTVAAARENLSVLALKGASAAVTGIKRDPTYAPLLARLGEADEISGKGELHEAASIYREVAEQASQATDPQVRLLGVVALGQLCFDLLSGKQWQALAQAAQQVIDRTADAALRPETETRILRRRSRACVHLGIALNRLGDRAAAVAAYDLLADFVGRQGDGDEEVADAVAGGLYNRAVLIDESGDLPSAITAYERVVEYQRDMSQTPQVRLREVRALRNKTLALTALGRHAEAADACRRVLDLCTGHAGEDFAQRARQAALELADAQRAQRLWDEAARTYEWILSGKGPAFPPGEMRNIQRLLKEVSAGGKPWWRPW